jgi:DNA-directed RNA polymerase sigma subunit (sigma70/sigma32)
MRSGFREGGDKTLSEVAEALGVTRECLRQVESKALKKLQRSRLLKNLIATYADRAAGNHHSPAPNQKKA